MAEARERRPHVTTPIAHRLAAEVARVRDRLFEPRLDAGAREERFAEWQKHVSAARA